MRNPRDRLPFIVAGLTQESPGGQKEHSLPDALLDLLQNIRRQHHRAAPAARTARVRVLFLIVVNLDAAVHMLSRDINLLLRKQVKQEFLPHFAEIAGDNPIIILRLPAEIRQILRNRIRRRRRHAGAHIHGILHTVIHDFADRHTLHHRPGLLPRL